jgi:hypothetical protein
MTEVRFLPPALKYIKKIKDKRLKKLYQNAIDKVNGELGSNIYIPDKNKEKFYNNVKHMSPSEVENLLRNEYKDITSGKPFITQSEPNSYTKSYAMKNGQKKQDTSPMHVRQDIILKSIQGHTH